MMPPKRKPIDQPESIGTRRSARTVNPEPDSREAIEEGTSSTSKKKQKTNETSESPTTGRQGITTDRKVDQTFAASGPKKLRVGDVLPSLTLQNHESVPISLLEEAKENGIVLFSYPAASTPGCTSQACSYRDNYAEITKRGYKVFGISTDTVNAQQKFKLKQNFQYPLLSDPKKEMLGPLGGSTSAKKTALRCHWVFKKGGTLEAVALNIKPKDCVATALKSIDAIEQ